MGFSLGSVEQFVLREAGYVDEDVQKLAEILNNKVPQYEAVLQSATQVLQTDQAEFAAGQAVVSPPVGASISNHPYKITVHFDPA